MACTCGLIRSLPNGFGRLESPAWSPPEQDSEGAGSDLWGLSTQAEEVREAWHSYIGIPINFHEESGIVTF